MIKHLIKLIGLLAFGTAAFMVAATSHAAPTKAKEVVVKAKKPAQKAAPKKDDGKIKPLDPSRKVPTLKKKYKKD